ncbi:tRNA(Arg) A34 adenosine deaminase TadA [Paenibacillus sp. UNC496MF]|uniref:nucleoside deaminase n=1 Tax=Paenibacillus sp. UNC496MF TaxID=1502753 RepID=UPI0008EFCD6F|nr:nucleoside deaminase [Paenibacillus sp. UNC496MF]SFI33198.1 tRNA(Arg) A34 adenosine deaminase TadA [Paenibacillus sp. UNC496MF]
MNNRERHIGLLRRSIEVSKAARAAGNTPFGALLADAEGRILLEQGNVEVTTGDCTGHAEAALMAEASKRYAKEELRTYALYASTEPCAMCAGAIYWGDVGTVVYAMAEEKLIGLTGGDERNLTLRLPCRDVFAAGRKPVEVIGPFPELEAEAAAAHEGYWR